MTTKYYLTTLIFFLLFSFSYSQNSLGKTDDLGRIQLSTYISSQIDGLPESAKNLLKNKLNQIASLNGIGGTQNSRFIITPNITVLFKEVLPGPPRKVVLSLEVYFYIGDGIKGTLFSSEIMKIKGVGASDAKAYISAIKLIKARNPLFKNFVDQGKAKIVEYYNSKCDFIKKEALAKADRKDFDEAIASLLAVPKVCNECYIACQDLTIKVYKMKMENDCTENIQKATVAKTNNKWDEAVPYLTAIPPGVSCYDAAQILLQNIEDHRCTETIGKAKGAWANKDSKLASSYLSEVSFDSKCADEAKQLFSNIANKLDADEKREWGLAYEKYNRNQTFKENHGFELKETAIEAARDIGVAYGKNQPKVIYNIRGWL